MADKNLSTPVQPIDVTKSKTEAPQNVNTPATSTPSPGAAIKAADSVQREQNVAPNNPPKSPGQIAAEAGKGDPVKEKTKVEQGQPLASGATDVKQNREEVTKPTQIPDIKKPANNEPGPIAGSVGGGSSSGGPPISNKSLAENRISGPGPNETEKKLMNENKPKFPMEQPAHEIVASNPIVGGTMSATNVNLEGPSGQKRVGVESRLSGVTMNPSDTNAVKFDEVGATGPSGTPGTGNSGVTTGGQVPTDTTKQIVYTVLLADSKLKDMGFTHLVAVNESRKIVAAFASEADAVKYSDMINK